MRPSDTSPESSRLDDHIEGCRRMLQALSEKGMELARALDPSDDAVSPGELALAFSRLSRSIRLNIMLSLRLDELSAGGLTALAAERALAALAPEADAAEAAEPVEPTEPAEPADPCESRERLDREAPDEALRWMKRPMPEVVAAICRDLRLPAEAAAEAQAPFAALVANDDGPDDPPACRTAGSTREPPASPAAGVRPRSSLKARLMGASAAASALGP